MKVASLRNPMPYKQLATDTPTRTRISSFWFTSDVVLKETRLSQWDSYVSFYMDMDVYVQRWYRKRTTYCVSGGVTWEYLKRLTKQTPFWLIVRNRSLRNPQEQVDRKIRDLSNQPRLMRVTPIALPCTWVLEPIKVWRSLRLTLRCKPYGKVHWEAHRKGFHSKEGLHYCFWQSVMNQLELNQVQRALEKASGSCLLDKQESTLFLRSEIRSRFQSRAVLHWLSGGLSHAGNCQFDD